MNFLRKLVNFVQNWLLMENERQNVIAAETAFSLFFRIPKSIKCCKKGFYLDL